MVWAKSTRNIKTVIINGEVFNRLGFSRRIDLNLKYRVTLMKGEYSQKDHFIANTKPYLVLVLSGKDLINYPFDILNLNAGLKVKDVSSNSLLQNTKPDTISYKSENKQKQNVSDKILEAKNIYQNKKPFESKFHFKDTISFNNKNEILDDLSLNVEQQPIDSIEKDNLKHHSISFFKKHKWFFIVFSGITVGFIASLSFNKSSSQRQKITHREDIYY